MKQLIFGLVWVLGFGLLVFAQSQTTCPQIEVSGGGHLRAGEPMTFSVNFSRAAENQKLEYRWTITNGTIVDGLTFPTVTVDTTGLGETNITATVEVKGLHENCSNVASETGSVYVSGDPLLFDEFGKISRTEIKARLRNLTIELNDRLGSQAYIINYGTDKEIALCEKRIRDAISLFKFDASRITLVRGGANPNGAGVFTKIWIVPPGADNPQP